MTHPGEEARLCCRDLRETVLVSTEGIMTYSLEREREQKCKDSQSNSAGRGLQPPCGRRAGDGCEDGVGWGHRDPRAGGWAGPLQE